MTAQLLKIRTVLSLNVLCACVRGWRAWHRLSRRSSAPPERAPDTSLRPSCARPGRVAAEKHGSIEPIRGHQQHAIRRGVEPRGGVVRFLRILRASADGRSSPSDDRDTAGTAPCTRPARALRPGFTCASTARVKSAPERSPFMAGAMKYENTIASEPSATGHAAQWRAHAGEREPGAAQREIHVERSGTVEIGRGRWPRPRTSPARHARRRARPRRRRMRRRARSPRGARRRAPAPIRGTAAPRAPAPAAPAGCRCRACPGSPRRTPAR